MGRAIDCALANEVDDDELEAFTYNTKERVRKYFKFNDLLDGTATSLPEGDTCEN